MDKYFGEAVIAQTYDLHEYPIPRLFIVLPKSSRIQDKITNPFVKQFRLYFVSECGEHTMTEGIKIPHEIHLAKHGGYRLDQPSELINKYESYVVTMMEMVKFGFTAAGIIVPALGNLKIVEGLEMVEKVDQTIAHIQQQQKNTSAIVNSTDDGAELDWQEVPEGTDLRQLKSYLRVKDEGRVLGNLCRIVSTEGNVKWVCIDHYRENYRSSVTQ
ncbi:hypothetical protein BGX28_002409 [Mortierella sp. GBA30]|nr:hypothetical protein BGX28_002409 [Mortierella sp. GBA30]